jgi:pimeloyl-ACP methyl ester carboxylesterase
MKPFYLVETVTKDNLIEHGIYFEPKKKGKKAILWVHGLTGAFYGDTELFGEFADACEKSGVGFAAFNNRGHELLSGFRKLDKTASTGYTHVTIGAGYETFEDCVYDIDAGISFLEKEGYTKIILLGHSTGSNKVCYYASTKNDKRVMGVILAGPVSDRLDPTMDQKKVASDRKKMQDLVKRGKGDELVFGFHFFPMTPKRYLSLFGPGSNEDSFDYGDESPKLPHFSAIKIPTMVVIGEKDEYADRPVKDVVKVFDAKAKMDHYKSAIISNGLHAFEGNEKAAVEKMVRWINLL